MKTHTIAILAFIAAALAAGAILVITRTVPERAPSGAGEYVLPSLRERVNDVAAIEIQRDGKTFTYRRAEQGWGLAEKSGYPAQVENIRSMVLALADLRVLEEKTSRPDRYERIGVQDPPTSPDAAPDDEFDPAVAEKPKPTLVTLRDAKDEALASIILGKQEWSATPAVYVRRAGEAKSWLAKGRVDVPWEPMAWVDKTAVNISREKVQSVTVTRPGGEVIRAMRADSTQTVFFVENVPAGRELKTPQSGESLGGAFGYVTFDDVAPLESIDFSTAAEQPVTVLRTFDGMVVTARTARVDDKVWAHFEAAVDDSAAAPTEPAPDAAEGDAPAAAQPTPDLAAARKQADELNTKIGKWAYALPDYKLKALHTTWDDLLKPPTDAAPLEMPAGPLGEHFPFDPDPGPHDPAPDDE